MDESLARRRRVNALALFQAHAEQALAGGAPPKGLEQAFAAALEISPSMWSQIKSSRPIGDKLARQIERHCGKPKEWLDAAHDSDAPTPAERAFLAPRARSAPRHRRRGTARTAHAAQGPGREQAARLSAARPTEGASGRS